MITFQTTKIIKNGTSLAVVIPKNILRDLNFQRGDVIVFAVAEGDVLCLRKVKEAELLQLKPKIIYA